MRLLTQPLAYGPLIPANQQPSLPIAHPDSFLSPHHSDKAYKEKRNKTGAPSHPIQLPQLVQTPIPFPSSCLFGGRNRGLETS